MRKAEVRKFSVSDGVQGTVESSTELMRLAMNDASRPDDIVPLANSITKSCDPRDELSKASAIFYWIRKNIRYQRDPITIEFYQTPHRLLITKVGDCDCMSALFFSLCAAVGIEGRFVLVAANKKYPNAYNHIYNEANCNGRWIAFDCSYPKAVPGWQPNKIYRKEYIHMQDAEMTTKDCTGCPEEFTTNCGGKPCSCNMNQVLPNEVEVCRPFLRRLPEFYRADFAEPMAFGVETRNVDYALAPFAESTFPAEYTTYGYNTDGIFSKIKDAVKKVVKKIPTSPLGSALNIKDEKDRAEALQDEAKRQALLDNEIRKPIYAELKKEYDFQSAKLAELNSKLAEINKQITEISDKLDSEVLATQEQLNQSVINELNSFRSATESEFDGYKKNKVSILAMYDIIMPKG